MPYTELLGWLDYFSARPIDWRDDQRTYLLLQAQGVKERPERLFDSIAKLKKREQEIEDSIRLARTFVSSGMLNKLTGVALKNKVDWKITEDGHNKNET